MKAVGIRALAVKYPSTIRGNDYYANNFPEIVATLRTRALSRFWNAEHRTQDPWEAAMAPFLSDPFRGTIERRVLGPGESALSLELAAARAVLAAAGRRPDDVPCLIASTFIRDDLGVGNAPYLARDLGLRGSAFNIESACAGALVGLKTAAALVRAGDYDEVLVVVSCTYSRVVDDRETLTWFVGDGSGAFLVGPEEPGVGVLGSHVLHTGDTCGRIRMTIGETEPSKPRLLMQFDPTAGLVLRETAALHLERCCSEALAKAGVTLSQIDHLIVNTPIAWFAPFAARVLGMDPANVVNVHAKYANIGPALTTANLYEAASTGRLRKGDLVLAYAVGSVSSTAAVVMRWGDVKLGPPDP